MSNIMSNSSFIFSTKEHVTISLNFKKAWTVCCVREEREGVRHVLAGQRKKYDLDWCGRLADRNDRPKVGGWRRKCRSVVSARGVKPHQVKCGDFCSVGGGVYQSR